MGVYTQNTTGAALVGLGMPEPSDIHWRIANFFTRELGKKVMPLEAGTEAPTSKNKHYRVVDFAIRQFKDRQSDIVFFIEICHKDTYKDAVKRTLECISKNKPVEAFIFQYDSKTFERVYNKDRIITNSYSEFLKLDLWELLKDFYYYIIATS